MPPKIELFYDVVSPYSWFAFETLLRFEKAWGFDLVLRPFFPGGVLKATGNQPPAMLPPKALFLLRDLERCQREFDVPLTQPTDVSFLTRNTLPAMRLLSLLEDEDRPELQSVSRCFWQRFWGEHAEVSEQTTLLSVAEKGGVPLADAQRLVAHVSKPEVKDALKAKTQEAIDRGAFGAPTLWVTTRGEPEMYFGSDRFSHIAHQLGQVWRGPRH
jgi:glutathione S-transferase kappa 1